MYQIFGAGVTVSYVLRDEFCDWRLCPLQVQFLTAEISLQLQLLKHLLYCSKLVRISVI